MQIVSNGDNLNEISNPASRKIKKININFSSAELAQRVVKVKHHMHFKVFTAPD